jgi:rubredoxin
MSNYRARAKTHLRDGGDGDTRCGRTAAMNVLYADGDADATCRVCNGVAAQRGRKPRISYKMPNPGPASGLGKLRCVICGRPYREHPVARPCMGGQWITSR